MSAEHPINASGGTTPTEVLRAHLASLKLLYVLEHFESLIKDAGEEQWPHVDYLARLMEGEAHQREDRSIQRRVGLARFPVLKTLDQFDWGWPKKINRAQVPHLFRLEFRPHHGNVILLGPVGVGKTHLAIALAHAICLHGTTALFTGAVDIVNTLAAARATGGIKREIARFLKPSLLAIDELG